MKYSIIPIMVINVSGKMENKYIPVPHTYIYIRISFVYGMVFHFVYKMLQYNEVYLLIFQEKKKN